MKKNNVIKILIWVFCSAIVLLLLTIVTCHFIVVGNASGRTYNDVDSIPHNRYGLLLATSPITPRGAHNFFFDNRIKAADELYKAGKIDFIIASGGDYIKKHENGCDEPAAIRDSLVVRGIPADRIILDYEGLRTLNSIVKAKEIYGLDSVTLISQKYHNERAIYLADHYGLHAIGYNAELSPIRCNRIKNTLREFLARPKMFLDLALGRKPMFNEESMPAVSTTKDASVQVVDTLGLRIYYPNYSRIDLVCGDMPSKEDDSVIMFAEAAFTGELLDTFRHTNIAGDHVSNGKRYKGFLCKRNNGAFVYYNGKPKFVYRNYSAEFDKAASCVSCGFAQEMIIHNGKKVPHTRKAATTNEFRALCLIYGKVVLADSQGVMKFGDFINNLIKAETTEALYLDMGSGWNYSWYRDAEGNPIEIHPIPTKYATNWIAFFK